MNEATIKISQDLQNIAGALEEVITEVAGEKLAFCLIVFTEGRASYVANADREEVKQNMRDLLEYWDKGMPDIKAHEYKG